jgi:serine/threonine protein kinase/tetratricopeptide (TPR) repeat protein
MIAPAGRKLGKYEIRRKLGRGGMADVYLAEDAEGKGLVALKLIEHSDDADTRDFIDAERRGAGLQARLAEVDARVTRVYDVGDLDGYFFVAMEYIDGQDLAELMRRGPLAVEFAADVAIAVAGALESAHGLQATIEGKDFQGIVHGDIKPRNIRIDSHGEVRVLDFGIAKALSLSRRLTRNEFGSVPYASPERLDSGQVNAQCDLWSLAVMLYEMVTGVQPYQAGNTEVLERMIRSRIPPPPAPDPCPEALRRILAKAMAPDSAVRYATAEEFAADLRAFRRGEPVRAMSEDLNATRRSSVRFAPAPAGDEATRRTPPPAPEDETRRTAPVELTAVSGARPPAPAGPTIVSRDLSPPAASVEWPHVGGRKPPGRLTVAIMRVVAALGLFLALYLTWSVMSAVRLYGRGQDFERQVETEQLTDPERIWSKWTELSAGHSSSWLLRGPGNAMKRKLAEAAGRVIDSYRNDTQPLYEADWRRARNYLARALTAGPDATVLGELRLCDGHLARINGTAHRSAAALNQAVQDFNEAQTLMPNSPDPELGLARVYVYGLKDIDKANEALQQAARRGYKPGNRDKLQLADGYCERADRLWSDSHNVRGLPQEKDQIERAAADYQTALGLYQSIAPYGNANARILRLRIDLLGVNFRLQQIDLSDSGGPERQ